MNQKELMAFKKWFTQLIWHCGVLVIFQNIFMAQHLLKMCKCLLVHLGFKCGGMALIDFTNSLPDGDNYESLCLIGSKGVAYADDHRNRNLFFNGGAPNKMPRYKTRLYETNAH